MLYLTDSVLGYNSQFSTRYVALALPVLSWLPCQYHHGFGAVWRFERWALQASASLFCVCEGALVLPNSDTIIPHFSVCACRVTLKSTTPTSAYIEYNTI